MDASPAPRDVLARLAVVFAYAGGALFVSVAILSVVSITSRALWSKPIQGDYELVQLASAIFVSLCLPYTQLKRANIIVDFFTTRASAAARGRLDALGALLLAIVMSVLAWRVCAGAVSMREAGETTTILGWPLWHAYAAMVPGIALTAVIAFRTAIEHLREARS